MIGAGLLPPVLPEPPSRAPVDAPKGRRRRRDRDEVDEDDSDGVIRPPPRARRDQLTRDQWMAVILLPVIMVGGSKLAFWFIVKVLDAWCIALDLRCKPEGY